MPRDVSTNLLLRGRVRASMVLPVPILPGLDATETEDTSPESLAKFRAAATIPTARQSAEDAARHEEAARRAQFAPATLNRLIGAGSLTPVAGSAWSASAIGPIPFPYTIHNYYITIGDLNVAGSVTAVENALLVSQNNAITLDALQADTEVFLVTGTRISGIGSILVQSHGQRGFNDVIPIGFNVDIYPTFLKFLTTTPGGTIVGRMHAEIGEQPQLLVTGRPFLPPIGRTTININTAGATPRRASPPPPRAAEISVTQAGRILSSRIVAWESLAPSIRADWFNRQVGGAADPNIRWIP